MPPAVARRPLLARRLATLALGLVLIGSGVANTIRAELGVAPWDVLTTGIAEFTGLHLGVAAMVMPVLFTIGGWLLGRAPGLGTVLAVLLVGPILGVVVELLPAQEAMVPRLAHFAVGFLLIATGITAVIVAEMGPGPLELVMLAIHERGRSLAAVRTAIELGCVALGWALGGQVGAGTIVAALAIGPLLRWMLEHAGYRSPQAAVATDLAAPAA